MNLAPQRVAARYIHRVVHRQAFWWPKRKPHGPTDNQLAAAVMGAEGDVGATKKILRDQQDYDGSLRMSRLEGLLHTLRNALRGVPSRTGVSLFVEAKKLIGLLVSGRIPAEGDTDWKGLLQVIDQAEAMLGARG